MGREAPSRASGSGSPPSVKRVHCHRQPYHLLFIVLCETTHGREDEEEEEQEEVVVVEQNDRNKDGEDEELSGDVS